MSNDTQESAVLCCCCLFVCWMVFSFGFFVVVVVVLVFFKSLSFYETYVHVIKLYEEGHKSKYQF